MRQEQRPFTDQERQRLKALWATAISDKDMEDRFGRGRGVLHREARDHLGLPARRVARKALVDVQHPVSRAVNP